MSLSDGIAGVITAAPRIERRAVKHNYPLLKLPVSMMKKTLCLLAAAMLLNGCAVKYYPKSPPVDEVQKTQLDCAGVQQLLAEQAQVQQQINKKGEFDSLTVVGVLLDFGIGNGISKSRAQKHATERQQQLNQLAQEKCQPVS